MKFLKRQRITRKKVVPEKEDGYALGAVCGGLAQADVTVIKVD